MKAYEWALVQQWAVTRPALEAGLAIAARLADPEAVEQRRGEPLDNTHTVTVRREYGPGVAVIPIQGPIFKRANLFTRISGGTSSEIIAGDLRTALDDATVAGIVLEVDSPGGVVTNTAELARMVREGRDRKPIVAHVDGSAASGAYWIASAASSIVVSPTAELGSIGVVQAFLDPKRANAGTIEYVSTHAPYKRVDPTSDAGKAEIMRNLDDLHAVFEAAVAEHRGVKVERVRRDFGRGGTLIGDRAIRAGMADLVMSSEALVRELAKGNPPGRPRRRSPKKEPAMPSWRENALKAIFGGDANAEASEDDDTPPVPEPAPKPAARSRAEPVISRDDPEKAELRRQVAEHEAEKRKSRLASIATEADEFTARMIREGKVFPAEAKHVATTYARAALDDAGISDAVIAYDDANRAVAVAASDPSLLPKPDRLGTIKAAFEARTPHGLTEEKIPGPLTALSPQKHSGDDKDFDAAVKAYADRLSARN